MTPSDVKIVAENINDFIEVPDGINRLRKAVLTLALSGQLVPQDISEGTAEQLYSQIQEKRKELEKGGVIKKAKELLPVDSEEIPFDIPKTWKWIRLGSVVNVQTGTLDANAANPNGDYPFFTCADESLKIDRFAYDCECVLLAGNGNFNVKYYKGKFEAYQRTYIIESFNNSVFVPFLFYLVQSQTDRFKASSLGSAMPYIRLGYITEAMVALPPYAEQKRIVEKVQSVMKQLDELESQKNERDLVRSRLTRSAMQALGTADSKIVFDKCTELVKTQEDVRGLENAILNLGISGRLIKPSNGSVDELYENIRNERRLLESDSSTRKKKITTLEPVADGEIPFEIPSSWKWVRLGEIFLIERGGSPRPIESYVTEDPQGLNWIKIGDTEKGGKYISSTKERIIKEGLKKTRQVHSGDLLLTNSMSFGRPYILKIDGCIHDGWLVLHPYHDDLVRDFYYYALSSPVFFQQFLNLVSGAVVKNLNAEKVRSVLIPLPPIAEQKQIVEKIEELMKMVNELKTIISN